MINIYLIIGLLNSLRDQFTTNANIVAHSIPK